MVIYLERISLIVFLGSKFMFVFYNMKDWTIQLLGSFTTINFHASVICFFSVCLRDLFPMSQTPCLVG